MMVSPFVDETAKATTSSKIQNDEISSTKGSSSEDESLEKELNSGDESVSQLLSSEDEVSKEEATTSQSVDSKLSDDSYEDETEKETQLKNHDTPPVEDIIKVGACDETTETDIGTIEENESIEISDEDSINDDADNETSFENYGTPKVSSNLKLQNSADQGVGVDFSDNSEAMKSGSITYTLISVHVETFRVSNDPIINLTQIGCTTALTGGKEKGTFFQPIKPSNLEELLEKHKMEGDLLKALHITDENGKFEFRAQFEIRKRKEKNKIYAINEAEALKLFWEFLSDYKNVVLATVDEATMELVLAKLLETRPENNTVVGFTTWPKVLEHCIKFAGKDVYEEEHDLEDFYTNHCGNIKGYINALDVAQFMGKSIKRIGADFARKFATLNSESRFTKNDFIEEIVEDVRNIEPNKTAKVELNKPLTVEVFSSFRPAVSTTIGIQEMDMVELSSGSESEDSDIGIVEENLRPKKYTKRNFFQDKDLLSAKRKHPYDFPEYPVAKRPVLNFSGEPIVISSEDEDDELSLDEELPSVSATKRVGTVSSSPKYSNLKYTEELLKKNLSNIKVTKVHELDEDKEGTWLGKSTRITSGSNDNDSSELLLADDLTVDEQKLDKDEEFAVDEEKLDKDMEHVRKTFHFESSNVPLA